MGGSTIQKARADSTLWRGICTVRDTNRPKPRSEYVERLRRSVAGFKFGPPDVQVTVTGKNRRPLGVAIAEITVRTKEGDEVPATHRSYWAWQPGPPAGQISAAECLDHLAGQPIGTFQVTRCMRGGHPHHQTSAASA
jgi:hypothetical protein